MKKATQLLAAPLLAAGALGQFVPAPTDLITKQGYANVSVRYKQVPPGICELNPNVKSYSGYADVEENQHIFWWFFEARNQDPKDAPLTIWINGGPGSSSMIGLFQELGPCGVGPDLKPYDNPYSWTNVSNLLVIDQPTQTGFSYSIPIPGYYDGAHIVELPNATCPDYAVAKYEFCATYSKPDFTLTSNTTQGAAPNMWKTLQGFMGAFPEYARHGINFATESYGGHYAPVFSKYFLDQNAKQIPGAHKIELENVLIGNGWLDPLVQYQAYYNFSVERGNTYDFDPFNQTVKDELFSNLYGPGNCVDRIKQCYKDGSNSVCFEADHFCNDKVQAPYGLSGRDEYDVRELKPDPFPYPYFEDYLNLPEVQKAIGAFQNYSSFAPTVGTAFDNTGDDGRESGTIEACQKLLAAGVQVMLYYGDADYLCNWLGGQVVADKIQAEGYSKAGFANISTSDGIVHGQVKQSGLFSFVRIYEAGHEVPFYQPLVALEMFERALKRVDVATGKEKLSHGYRTVGPPTSDYREGNATVQFQVTPANATYNTTLNGPNPVEQLRRRDLAKRLWRPRRSRGGKRTL